MVGADSAPRLLSVGFALLTALSLYAYARRFLDQATGYVAALAFFGAGMVTQVSTTARIDVTLAGILFLATYAMAVYLEERVAKWLWLSAFFSGVAISIKLTGLLWVAILGCVYLLQLGYKSFRADLVVHLRRGVFYFLIVLALVSPWLLKNYVYFHDPIYPLVSGETVTSRRSEPLAGFGPAEEQRLETYFQRTKESNSQVAENTRTILANAAAYRPDRHPFQFWGYFTDPNLFNVGEPNHTPNYLFILCPCFIFFGRDRRLIWLAISCVVFFVGMSWSAWTARYLLPIYPPLTLIAAYTIVQATAWLKSKSAMAIAIPVIALLLTTGNTLRLETLQMIRTRELNYINGSISRADYMGQFFYYPSLRYVNENIGADAKVFMMGCQMGYDLQRPYVADTSWDSTPWRRLLLKGESPQDVRNAMKADGITHVLYSADLYPFAARTGTWNVTVGNSTGSGRPDYYEQWRNWTTFEDFKAQYLEQVYEDQFGYRLFTLR
jgi:4-amino-4-deoxy-L-arabinose transferase-like glycosyltransferase